MRQIKFRGRKLPVDGGEYAYGFYVHSTGEVEGNKYECNGIWDTDNGHKYWRIEPDSVAQLVGHDKDGNEVYEGDILTYGNEEWTAALGSYMRNSGALCHYNFSNAILKEKD